MDAARARCSRSMMSARATSMAARSSSVGLPEIEVISTSPSAGRCAPSFANPSLTREARFRACAAESSRVCCEASRESARRRTRVSRGSMTSST